MLLFQGLTLRLAGTLTPLIFFLFLTHPTTREEPTLAVEQAIWRDILYSSWVGDGSCLPGIVFTEDTSLAEKSYSHIKVVVVENTAAPGANTTKRWFDLVKDSLEDCPVLMVGNLGGHHNKQFLTEIREFGISLLFFPNHGGKYLNPCDNSIQSIIRRHYLHCPRQTHEQKLAAINEAYKAVSEESVQNCFKETGLLSHEPPHKVVRRLQKHTYLGHAQRRDDLAAMITEYRRWKRHLRDPSFSADDPLPPREGENALASALDGLYWTGSPASE